MCPLLTGPTTPSWPSWLRYRGKYCDSNNGGGDIIQPDSVTPISLSQCQQACEENSLCEGIVVRGFDTTQYEDITFIGHCIKITNLKLGECSDSQKTDVVFARSGGNLKVYFVNFSLRTLPYDFLNTMRISEKVCMTKDGPQPDRVCIFPFTFKNVTYYECANAGRGSKQHCNPDPYSKNVGH